MAIVATGAADGWNVPVVVRNGTDRPVANIEVSAELRDAAGTLIGADQGTNFYPAIVPAGGVAVGGVWFSQEVPPGATAEYAANASEDLTLASMSGRVPVELVEFTARPDAIAGTFRNPTSTPLLGKVSFILACFAEDGTPLGWEPGMAIRADLAPGETTPFQAYLLGRVPPCQRFLISASGTTK